MSQDLSIENHKSGLERDYEKRRVNSFELGKKAIDTLLAEGKEVTLHNVSKKTKELDEQGKGIHFNTIEIMKNSMRIIKKRVRAIRKNKKS